MESVYERLAKKYKPGMLVQLKNKGSATAARVGYVGNFYGAPYVSAKIAKGARAGEEAHLDENLVAPHPKQKLYERLQAAKRVSTAKKAMELATQHARAAATRSTSSGITTPGSHIRKSWEGEKLTEKVVFHGGPQPKPSSIKMLPHGEDPHERGLTFPKKVMSEQKPHSTQLYRGQANFQSPTTAFGKAKLALLVAKDDIRSGERAASTVQKDLIKKGLSSTRASAFVQKHNKSFSGAGSGLNSAQIARANRHGLSSLVGGGSGGGQPRVPAGSPAGGQFARK